MKNQHNNTNGNERQQNVEIKDLQVKQDPEGGPHYSNFNRTKLYSRKSYFDARGTNRKLLYCRY
jgi:hypothetical protein